MIGMAKGGRSADESIKEDFLSGKEKKALAMRDKGHPIKIMSENVFFRRYLSPDL
jgi:hypothetical protein